jgi:hypothetical protein
MYAFDDVWGDLCRFATNADRLGTVDDEYVNDVWYDADEDAIHVEYDSTEVVSREAMRRLWKTFEDGGEITMPAAREEFGERAGAAVLGLLNEGFGLPYDTDPVRVYSPSDRP